MLSRLGSARQGSSQAGVSSFFVRNQLCNASISASTTLQCQSVNEVGGKKMVMKREQCKYTDRSVSIVNRWGDVGSSSRSQGVTVWRGRRVRGEIRGSCAPGIPLCHLFHHCCLYWAGKCLQSPVACEVMNVRR